MLLPPFALGDPSACARIAASLPSAGTELPNLPLLQSLELLSKGAITLPKETSDGLSMESEYGGSLGCQRYHLYRSSPQGRSEVTVPDSYQDGEGRFCAGDEVALMEISGRAALVENTPAEGSAALRIVERENDGWSKSCRLAVTIKSHYEAAEHSCRGKSCDELTKIGGILADTYGAGEAARAELRARQLPTENVASWTRMVSIATKQNLAWADAPLSGSSGLPKSYREARDRFFVPIIIDGKLLLGNLGTAGFGFGIHTYGPLLSVYELVGKKLEPIAGYNFTVGGEILGTVTVDPPTTALPSPKRTHNGPTIKISY